MSTLICDGDQNVFDGKCNLSFKVNLGSRIVLVTERYCAILARIIEQEKQETKTKTPGLGLGRVQVSIGDM